MYGIFKYSNGLKFVCVAWSKESAINYLYDLHYNPNYFCKLLNPIEWWEIETAHRSGAANMYEIREIEIH